MTNSNDVFFFLPGPFPFCYLLHFCSPDPDFVLCWFFEVIQQVITIYTVHIWLLTLVLLGWPVVF